MAIYQHTLRSHTEPAYDVESAVSHVLRLPELLELVLVHLSLSELLLSQRVSRGFRDSVRGSILLQRALFLAPNWRLEGEPAGQKPVNNRMLLRAFPSHYPTVSPVIVNDSPTPEEYETGRRGSTSKTWDVSVSFPADSITNCSPAVSYPEASWRSMYLCQPPCANLYLERRYQKSIRPAMIREDGITMGELVDETMGAKDKGVWHQSYISSDGDWHFVGTIKVTPT
ncbi:hypothetical protein LTR17_003532 [Elasticomyces elasticus]|nr:hypothetical protein LTR17_003532 [Elasticomyces elasticus]